MISAQPTYEADMSADGYCQILRWLSIFRYDSRGIETVNVDFFPQLDVFIPNYRVARPTKFLDVTVYIGAETVNDHQWFPMGLFSIINSAGDTRL
jgi:hypothetical protein